MLISCIAIDDEPLALSKIEGFIQSVSYLKLIRTFDNAVEAAEWLKHNQTDLIFLDIQMRQLTGIEFLEATGTTARIIITSAYDQYAIKGYELNVTDYLLKPFSFQRFVQAIGKVLDFYQHTGDIMKEEEDNTDYIFVKTEYRHEKVNLGEILYIEGMKDYLRIVCISRKIMTLQSFSRIEECLPPKKFCRIHKSFIVSIDKIKSIERGMVIIGDQRIPVSNTYKDNFFSRIGL
jgi:DNA-binding LytR/AlgR family response regulator